MDTEKIAQRLSDIKVKKLVDLLNEDGFRVSRTGHVDIKQPNPDHPRWKEFHLLPVAYIPLNPAVPDYGAVYLVNRSYRQMEYAHDKFKEFLKEL